MISTVQRIQTPFIYSDGSTLVATSSELHILSPIYIYIHSAYQVCTHFFTRVYSASKVRITVIGQPGDAVRWIMLWSWGDLQISQMYINWRRRGENQANEKLKKKQWKSISKLYWRKLQMPTRQSTLSPSSRTVISLVKWGRQVSAQ